MRIEIEVTIGRDCGMLSMQLLLIGKNLVCATESQVVWNQTHSPRSGYEGDNESNTCTMPSYLWCFSDRRVEI